MSFSTRSRPQFTRHLYSSRPRTKTRPSLFSSSGIDRFEPRSSERLFSRHVYPTTSSRCTSFWWISPSETFDFHFHSCLDNVLFLFFASPTSPSTDETSEETSSSRSNLSRRIRSTQLCRSSTFRRLRRSTRRRFRFRPGSKNELGRFEESIARKRRVDQWGLRSTVRTVETEWTSESREWIGWVRERRSRRRRNFEIESLKFNFLETDEWFLSNSDTGKYDAICRTSRVRTGRIRSKWRFDNLRNRPFKCTSRT